MWLTKYKAETLCNSIASDVNFQIAAHIIDLTFLYQSLYIVDYRRCLDENRQRGCESWFDRDRLG